MLWFAPSAFAVPEPKLESRLLSSRHPPIPPGRMPSVRVRLERLGASAAVPAVQLWPSPAVPRPPFPSYAQVKPGPRQLCRLVCPPPPPLPFPPSRVQVKQEPLAGRDCGKWVRVRNVVVGHAGGGSVPAQQLGSCCALAVRAAGQLKHGAWCSDACMHVGSAGGGAASMGMCTYMIWACVHVRKHGLGMHACRYR
eukprot:329677-Chlamydomonas_euryale.AAC.2